MSYILDALKKSEQERQRGNVPDIKAVHNSTAKSVTESRRSWWIYLFVLVLLVNGAIVAVIYLDDKGLGDTSGETATQTARDSKLASLQSEQKVDSTAAPVVEAAQPHLSAVPSSVEQTTPVDQPTSEATTQQAQQQAQKQPRVIFSKEPLDMSTDIPQVQVAKSSSPVVKEDETVSTEQADVPAEEAVLIAELPVSIRQKIPNIEFAGHVYSTAVERRSVMINGKKMREGDVVGSGLVLLAITPEGAEFEYEGYRFKLSALQDWTSN